MCLRGFRISSGMMLFQLAQELFVTAGKEEQADRQRRDLRDGNAHHTASTLILDSSHAEGSSTTS